MRSGKRGTARPFRRKATGWVGARQRRSYFGLIAWLAIGATCVAFFIAGPVPGESTEPLISSAGLRVIDGDTVDLADGRRVRLIGYDTPETFEPRCSKERRLGLKATRRLRQLTKNGHVDVELVRCSCAPADPDCNYERACGKLSVDGKNVGSVLIAEGLAKPYVCGFTTCPPHQSWC
jgi:endonuclease YncB( thermonuclease family)